ncbi:MAG: hypothetical protein HOG49_42705 [Candidatus Scalindua sp.]|nr:hypothetical protein [Candidatus Scalindua sp.]
MQYIIAANVSFCRRLRTWTEKTICIDTEGAQIRTGTIGDKSRIPLTVEEPWDILLPGSVLKIDFNSVMLQVIKEVAQVDRLERLYLKNDVNFRGVR